MNGCKVRQNYYVTKNQFYVKHHNSTSNYKITKAIIKVAWNSPLFIRRGLYYIGWFKKYAVATHVYGYIYYYNTFVYMYMYMGI